MYNWCKKMERNFKKKIEKNGKIGYLMMTYDGASFLWSDHFRLVKKYWPSFGKTFDKYLLMSETKSFSFDDKLVLRSLDCGKTFTFSQRIALAIQKLKCEYVFVTIDDYFLKGQVDMARLHECFAFLKNNKADYIEFENFRTTVKKKQYKPNYIKKLKKKMFLVNLQIGIWRSNSLLKIIRLYENPWQLEYYGSIRSCLSNFKGFTLKKGTPPIFDYDFGWLVQRGKFDKETFEYFVENEDVDPLLGETVGFKEREIKHRQPISKKIKHLFLSLLSIFRR